MRFAVAAPLAILAVLAASPAAAQSQATMEAVHVRIVNMTNNYWMYFAAGGRSNADHCSWGEPYYFGPRGGGVEAISCRSHGERRPFIIGIDVLSHTQPREQIGHVEFQHKHSIMSGGMQVKCNSMDLDDTSINMVPGPVGGYEFRNAKCDVVRTIRQTGIDTANRGPIYGAFHRIEITVEVWNR